MAKSARFLNFSNTGDTVNRVLFLAQCTYSCGISTCTIVNFPCKSHDLSDLDTFLCFTGEITIVQVDIQQLYVHCAKKSTRLTISPVFEKFKNRAYFAMLIHADQQPAAAMHATVAAVYRTHDRSYGYLY